MTYLSKLTGHQMSIIGAAIEAAQLLAPGQETTVRFKTPEFTAKARYWVYSYFHLNNLKSLYKLRQINSTKFSIRRVEEEHGIVETPPLNLAETFVVDHLLDTSKESEALKQITESDLPSEAKLQAFSEWKRITS